jgi:hypothetical protein
MRFGGIKCETPVSLRFHVVVLIRIYQLLRCNLAAVEDATEGFSAAACIVALVPMNRIYRRLPVMGISHTVGHFPHRLHGDGGLNEEESCPMFESPFRQACSDVHGLAS